MLGLFSVEAFSVGAFSALFFILSIQFLLNKRLADKDPAKQILKCERGVIGLEAALTIWPFLLVLITGMELLRYAYYDLATQYVVASSVRYGSLGGIHPTSSSTDRADDIEGNIILEAAKLGITLRDVDICIQSDPDRNCGTDNTNDDSGIPNN